VVTVRGTELTSVRRHQGQSLTIINDLAKTTHHWVWDQRSD